MHVYICIFAGLFPSLQMYNIESIWCIVKNDYISSYTNLINNVYRMYNLVESRSLSANVFPDCEWLWNRLLWGVTWSIIKRKHNRWDMHYLPRWALHALFPTITPKDAVTEKIMSSEEVGWQCIVCNVVLLTIQNVEISFKHFNGSWTEWTT